MSFLKYFFNYFLIIFVFIISSCVFDENIIEKFKPPGNWISQGGLPTSGKYRAVAVADLNNDGNSDVVAGGYQLEKISIWYGDGKGFMTGPEFIPVRGDVRSIALADVNNDGLKDIIFSIQRVSFGIRVWLNKSHKKWSMGKSPITLNNYEGIATADINKDGNIDIVAANSTSMDRGGIQLWLGDGKGNWPLEAGPTVNDIYMDVLLADFNQDGNLDLVGSGWGNNGAIRIWYGDGAGDWPFDFQFANGSYYDLSAADINGDNRLDLLAGTYRDGIKIFFGDSGEGFSQAFSPQTEGSYWKVLPVDLNDDLVPDILASSIDSEGIKAWINKGPKSWKHKKSMIDQELVDKQARVKASQWSSDPWTIIEDRFPPNGSFYDLVKADLNNDNSYDILAASYGQGIKVWHGNDIKIKSKWLIAREKIIGKRKLIKKNIEKNNTYTTLSGFPEYRIGPRDVLDITQWKGSVPKTEEITVKQDGTISFGLIENLDVNGFTITQLDELITKLLKKYIRNPRVDVTVKEYNSKYVMLMGAIERNTVGKSGPGKYKLVGKVGLLDMILYAGGPKDNANLQDISIRRKNGQTINIDLYGAINKGESIDQELILDSGDVIFVPALSKQKNRVFVFGAVKNPGAYNFEGSSITIIDAVAKAGGVNIYAHEENTKIFRGDMARPKIISSDLEKLVEEGDLTQNIVLANSDLVYVPRSIIGDIDRFVKQINPILRLIYMPYEAYRNVGATGAGPFLPF